MIFQNPLMDGEISVPFPKICDTNELMNDALQIPKTIAGRENLLHRADFLHQPTTVFFHSSGCCQFQCTNDFLSKTQPCKAQSF